MLTDSNRGLTNVVWDAVILGGGAAGLFCARTAGQRGRKVLVLDHAPNLGKKILISGGGRCNFTNLYVRPESYLSENPHFCRSALSRYTPEDFVRLVDSYGIEHYEKKLGQLFCRESARAVVDMLVSECEQSGVTILPNTRIRTIRRPDRFLVETDRGVFETATLVVATGGLSLPKTGATGLAYELAAQFGHALVPTRPGLVGMRLPPEDPLLGMELSGVSLEVVANCGEATFRENLLCTHRGLSGPAILQVSSYWKRDTPVRLDLLPGMDVSVWLEENSHQSLERLLRTCWPHRLAKGLSGLLADERPLAQWKKEQRRDLVRSLTAWEPPFCETEGYGKAEVTVGGINTRLLSSRTMESTLVSGLFFIGECVDVTGWLGGYNFHWAWASGYAAGQAL